MKRLVVLITLLFVGIACFAQTSRKQLTITDKEGKVYVGYLLEETNSYYRISEDSLVHIIYKEDIETLSVEDVLDEQNKPKTKKERKPIESKYLPKGIYGTASISTGAGFHLLPLSVGVAYRFSPVVSIGLNPFIDLAASADELSYGRLDWGGLLEIRTDFKGARISPFMSLSAGPEFMGKKYPDPVYGSELYIDARVIMKAGISVPFRNQESNRFSIGGNVELYRGEFYVGLSFSFDFSIK